MTDCAWGTMCNCDMYADNPTECQRYGKWCRDCKWDERKHGGSKRVLDEDHVRWAIYQIRSGRKTSWICEALHVSDHTLIRNIQACTGFQNISDVLNYCGTITLEYNQEDISWQTKLP